MYKRLLKIISIFLIITLFLSSNIFAVNVTDLNNETPMIKISQEGETYVNGGIIGDNYFVLALDENNHAYMYFSDEYKENWNKTKIKFPESEIPLDLVLYNLKYYLLSKNNENFSIYESRDLLNWKYLFSFNLEGEQPKVFSGDYSLILRTTKEDETILYQLNPEMHEVIKKETIDEKVNDFMYYKGIFMAATTENLYLISDSFSNMQMTTTPINDYIEKDIDKIIAYQQMETQCNRSSIFIMYESEGETFTQQIHIDVENLEWESLREFVKFDENIVKNYTSSTKVIGSWGYPMLIVNTDEFYIAQLKPGTSPLKCNAKKTDWLLQYDIPSDWAIREVREAAQNLILHPSCLPREYTSHITREEFAIYAYNLLRDYIILDGSSLESPFIDIDSEEITILYNIGIIKGTSTNTFSPDNLLTRAEAAVMISRIHSIFGNYQYEINYNYFADDNEIPNWAREDIYKIRTLGVVNGYENGKFGPNDKFTHEQSLMTLTRLKYLIHTQD